MCYVCLRDAGAVEVLDAQNV
jgi:hypothetical protein